jgi:4-carboxymuconolactone decarboxylase
MSEPSKRDKGREIVNKLFKDGPVGDLVPMPKRFRQFTVDHVFGDVWQGEDLEITERSLITCAMLVAMNREDEMCVHFIGAKNLGHPREKIEELITHAAHYAGWPAAISGFRALAEVWPPED